MRIGLLTVYFADFGSYQHTLSLYRLMEQMGHEVSLIHESHRYSRSVKLVAGHIAYRFLPKIAARVAKSNERLEKYIALQGEINKLKISPLCLNHRKRYRDFDCVVVGSDELWSATNKNIKFIPDYFGYSVHCDHISYATSAITLHQPKKKLWNRIQKGLCTFQHLSARDRDTVAMVEKMTNKPCAWVLDPALLNPVFDINDTTEQPYILVYGEHFSDMQKLAILAFAKEKQLPLIAVSWPHAWCNEFRRATSASALQQCFAQSSYCLSSTLHGTIFAIVYHRPFTSFYSSLRGKKVMELLNQLSLDDYLFEHSGVIQRLSPNYEDLDQRLAVLRADSLHYLKTALADVERRHRNAM